MESIFLVGSEEVSRAASRIASAAEDFNHVADRLEAAFERRRQWEEEYLQRLEAVSSSAPPEKP